MKTKINIKPLTQRELETLLWLLQDNCVKDVASKCFLTDNAIESRKRKLRQKVNAKYLWTVIFRLMYLDLIPQEVLDKAFEGNWQDGLK